MKLPFFKRWKKAGIDESPPSWKNDVIASLKELVSDKGLDASNLGLNIPLDESAGPAYQDRSDVVLYDGKQIAVWRVESLLDLFRGDSKPPPDSEMGHYPEQYTPFFYRVESHALSLCKAIHFPTDAQFLELYTLMRRRPDAKSTGPLHDAVWQGAAYALGFQPFSEAEYTAVFAQLARSARRWKMGASSRNYIAYLRKTFG